MDSKFNLYNTLRRETTWSKLRADLLTMIKKRSGVKVDKQPNDRRILEGFHRLRTFF